ncbi:hypothetical protein SAMN05216349_10379 [Oribacterium sp. KHPX15]|uniref:hypothetical protein n=1 Tax=unclassified Oribacterium TaxID=2629782 RepID=UPI0004E19C67|nr:MULTISPECIES: hypothetical protein [unclassified Oribacterium]SDZ97413.1 hypothetical protein SAMN05216349_10379 [Oribacterium sp. KHPX15]
MAINGNVEFKVKTEELVAKSSEVTGYINKTKELFENVLELVEHSNYYWVGLAGDHHRKLFTEEKPNIEKILQRLSEHPQDLLQMAGVYDTAEKTTAAANQAISSDLIS